MRPHLKYSANIKTVIVFDDCLWLKLLVILESICDASQ